MTTEIETKHEQNDNQSLDDWLSWVCFSEEPTTTATTEQTAAIESSPEVFEEESNETTSPSHHLAVHMEDPKPLSPIINLDKSEHVGTTCLNRVPKKVRFIEDRVRGRGCPSAIGNLTPELIDELWWKQHELVQMKLDARTALLKARDGAKDDVLGLDRFASERVAVKHRGNQIVLFADKHPERFPDDVSRAPSHQEFVRLISRKCSYWTRNISHALAQRLCFELRRDRMTLSNPSNTANRELESLKRRRAEPSSPRCNRRVRSRNSPSPAEQLSPEHIVAMVQ